MRWIEALKVWNNKQNGKRMIPRKGTKEYDEVKKIMESEKWIQEATKSMKEGSFTAQAKSAKMTTKDFMEEVLANPDKYTERTRKRAQFMKNVQKKGAGKKAEPIVMTKKAFEEEHKKLIGLLDNISKSAKAEADEQKKEVAKYKGGCSCMRE
jgi:hypothetical protein